MNTQAVSLGDNCIDHYLPPIEKTFIGGNALNVAVHMQRAGLPAAYVGAVGDDEHGRLILQALASVGVDVSHVRVLPGRTSFTDIRLTEQNERVFVHEHIGPVTTLELDAELLEFILEHRLVHTTWIGGADHYLSHLAGKQILISLDYGERYTPDFVERTIAWVHLAFFSTPEAQAYQAPHLAESMSQRGPKLVVVTMGRKGSLAYFNGALFTQPAHPVQVVDTLGAGDTFIGTFLAHWLRGADIPTCLERASWAAAQTCTHLGGWIWQPTPNTPGASA